MFDIAFSELMVIMVVALIVIGPERLPKMARTAGNLWGRVQRYVQSVKNDIANDMAIEEAKKLHGEIGKELDAVERAALEARISLKHRIMDAQLGKLHDAPREIEPPTPPVAPDKPA